MLSSVQAFPYNTDAEMEHEDSREFFVMGAPLGLDTWYGVVASSLVTALGDGGG